MKQLIFVIKYLLSPDFAILTFMNFTVFILTLTIKPPYPDYKTASTIAKTPKLSLTCAGTRAHKSSHITPEVFTLAHN